ncbi:MAG: Translation initiation factor 2 [Polyangiaceae bacterium]|jgi:hypothetical protein|nr:Translation initiation factor 2 [Polyangiaceae bacterium]
MTDPEDPVRLLDAEGAPPGLRDALQRARADVGTDAQVARLAGKLGPLLGSPAPLAAGTAGAPPASALAGKVGLGALALLVAGGGAWLLSSQKASAPPTPPAAVVAAPSVAPAPVPVVPPPTPVVVAAPSAEPTTPAAPEPGSARKIAPAGPSEAELLEQARAALKSGDSARALSRATEHAQRYPRGVLVQEREVLAIRALRGLGRDAEAERRAEAFSKAYPGSAFQRKLQR